MRADASSQNVSDLAQVQSISIPHSGNSKFAFEHLLDRTFSITARGSSVQTEVRSGCIAWMTMSYIMVVNPVILSRAATPDNPWQMEAIMTATGLSAGLSSLIVGLLADAPLGLMPGMGLNAYFAFGICHTFGVSWQQAMTCSFVSGVLLLIMAVMGICNWIVAKVLSDHLKKAITVAIGIFQALIGFQVMGLVVKSSNTLVGLGHVESDHQLWLALLGFCLISAMLVKGVHGALLIGILLMAVLSWCLELQPPPEGVFDLPRFDGAFTMDFSAWAPGSDTLPGMVVGTLVLLFVALFDLAGVQYGLMSIAGLLKDGQVPRGTSIFASAALGTMAGACLGTSPVIIANESSAGIVEGGRTGLSAVVVSILFFISAFIAPLLKAVPQLATAVPLVLIGAFMMAPCRGIDWDNLRVAIPSFLTMTVVPFTYSIHNGIIAGISMDLFLAFAARFSFKAKEKCATQPDSTSPLLQSRKSPFTSEMLFATPHASMAMMSLDDDSKVRRVRQLISEMRRRDPVKECEKGIEDKDDVLIRALETYLEGR